MPLILFNLILDYSFPLIPSRYRSKNLSFSTSVTSLTLVSMINLRCGTASTSSVLYTDVKSSSVSLWWAHARTGICKLKSRTNVVNNTSHLFLIKTSSPFLLLRSPVVNKLCKLSTYRFINPSSVSLSKSSAAS